MKHFVILKEAGFVLALFEEETREEAKARLVEVSANMKRMTPKELYRASHESLAALMQADVYVRLFIAEKRVQELEAALAAEQGKEPAPAPAPKKWSNGRFRSEK